MAENDHVVLVIIVPSINS